MNVGEKLKNARLSQGLTQDELAEKLKITRQTVSNWENSKSYPDVLQIIQLSELYSMSLDELVKEDEKMVRHLEKSTNIVQSRNRLIQLLSLGLYFIIWVLLIFWFWCGGAKESPLGYSLLVFYLISPFTIFVTSFILGTILNHKGWFLVSI
ncbi:MAG: helix-turn-helix domain-containing protein, partial [Anaeroplasmataceae bacterium]|nr:helix-turn-helix domain-containing protein [Anaeroplasmataceae bacterium]